MQHLRHKRDSIKQPPVGEWLSSSAHLAPGSLCGERSVLAHCEAEGLLHLLEVLQVLRVRRARGEQLSFDHPLGATQALQPRLVCLLLALRLRACSLLPGNASTC